MEKIPKGTRFEVTEDIDTDGLIHWHAAFTSGFHCVIPKGTILVTFQDCSASSAAVGLTPKDYEGFERSTFHKKTQWQRSTQDIRSCLRVPRLAKDCDSRTVTLERVLKSR